MYFARICVEKGFLSFCLFDFGFLFGRAGWGGFGSVLVGVFLLALVRFVFG